MKIKKFNQLNEKFTPEVIKHYLLRQNIEVKGLIRKKSNGEEVEINDVGVITKIEDMGHDIFYVVQFTDNSTWYVLHFEDADKIIRVF